MYLQMTGNINDWSAESGNEAPPSNEHSDHAIYLQRGKGHTR